MMNADSIKSLIENYLPNSQAIVKGDDGRHFEAIVISEAFNGKTRVQQQQLVYAIVNNYIVDGSLHALSLKTFTPEAWQAVNTNL